MAFGVIPAEHMYWRRQRWGVATARLEHRGTGSAFVRAQPPFCGGQAVAPVLVFEPPPMSIR